MLVMIVAEQLSLLIVFFSFLFKNQECKLHETKRGEPQSHIVKVSHVAPHASYGDGGISTDQQLPPSTSARHNSLNSRWGSHDTMSSEDETAPGGVWDARGRLVMDV